MKRALYLILGLFYALNAESFKDVLTKGDYTFFNKKVVSPIKRHADRSAFYLGLGYQLGSIQHNSSNLNLSQRFNKSQIIFSDSLSPVFKNSYVSNGLGVQVGYKWVGKHEETKWFGFRWGLFYDLSASLYGQKESQSVIISTYGTYMDLLLNAYNGDKFFAGFNLGIAFAGVYDRLSDALLYQALLQNTFGGKVNPNGFQFLVDLGVRLGNKRNQFGFGIKIPTYYFNHYYSMNNISNSNENVLKVLRFLEYGINSLLYQVDFRRNYSVYFNYTYSF
ncbi:outer membrane protein [Helicobacter pylori]|uniref:outer membrane protein n=1 Tax=Helicobacter pylori TaxID=210 RepID=UPI00026A09B2|nr:outer membrane protein [Helicobacter pylori]EJC11919.1 outer membrane insertion C-terminal signal domain protein [Helicobacter pylori Hp P-25]EJB47606.1 outer membrane protein HorI [Helicobacter pylori Hp H-16]EJC33178.1 outer membrane insertion C-terminal signal domain protein [Helicobacter pylori Hp P-25c]EJC35840.1 outer membrane insertion C-terminal signal domain protein [Helicobacter pylori Hp P-25d]EMH41405.1 outer membrane protein [Helicobacter pylori GAMchJs106B]